MTAPRSKVLPQIDAPLDETVPVLLPELLPSSGLLSFVEFAVVGAAVVGVAVVGVAVVGVAVVGVAVVGAGVAFTSEGARTSVAKTKPRIALEHIAWVQRQK